MYAEERRFGLLKYVTQTIYKVFPVNLFIFMLVVQINVCKLYAETILFVLFTFKINKS